MYPPRVYSTKLAAAMINVSPRTIRRMAKEGKFRTYGDCSTIDADQFDQFVIFYRNVRQVYKKTGPKRRFGDEGH